MNSMTTDNSNVADKANLEEKIEKCNDISKSPAETSEDNIKRVHCDKNQMQEKQISLEETSDCDNQKDKMATSPIAEKSYLETFKYHIEQDQKGLMLIINFTKDREGSENDVKTVRKFFEETLKFKVELEEDLSLANLRIELAGLVEQMTGVRRNRYYCFILVIMGHGNKDGICTVDQKITINEIIDIYSNKDMKDFLGKPKMVFVQTCRGGQKQPELLTDFKLDELHVQQDGDMLIAYSTAEDKVSNRNSVKGTAFIQILLDVVKEYYKESHLEEMLVIVRDTFIKRKVQQMPCTWSTLTKFFYLKNM